MFTEAKEAKAHKYLLLTALIALAVIISMAAAGKANAAEPEIKSIEYKQKQGTDVSYWSKIDDPFWLTYEGIPCYDIECDPERYKSVLKLYQEGDSMQWPIGNMEPYFYENDKLIISYVDGSTKTLSPRIIAHWTGGGSGEYTFIMAWFDESNNITDTVTNISWDIDKPKKYCDRNTGVEVFKEGSYNQTATVEVGSKKTTFTKKFVFDRTGTSYDKTLPVINHKKIKTGYTGSYKKGKNIIIKGFFTECPTYKNAESYAERIKLIYPESLGSSKYKTKTIVWNSIFNDIAKYPIRPTKKNAGDAEGSYLTADTMMEISANIVNSSTYGRGFVYGKFSKPVRVFLSKNKTLKAKGKKKSVRLTWDKVKNATGYTIKYSTKKNMSKAKTIKVKGENKKAYTIKKLKKNKKYYFQITPYKVYKGKTYTGYVSAKKAAKAK